MISNILLLVVILTIAMIVGADNRFSATINTPIDISAFTAVADGILVEPTTDT